MYIYIHTCICIYTYVYIYILYNPYYKVINENSQMLDLLWEIHDVFEYIHESMTDEHPGGLFIEPAFSTFAVFVIDFIPQITVVLHLSQSSISLKSTRVLFTGYVKKTSAALSFFCAKCSSQFLQWAWRGFCGNCFPISTAKREHASKSCHWARLT